MAEYYSNSISRKNDKRNHKMRSRKGLILFLLDIVMTAIMVGLVFATISVVVCQYVSPEKSGFLSILSLGAPIIYLLDIVVMFYWIVRWRWYRASTMIAMVVLGLFYLSRYYKIDFDRPYDATYNEREYTKVMTYNTLEGKKAELLAYIEQHNPDILCLQEITTKGENWEALSAKYKNTFRAEGEPANNQVLSKYPIVNSGDIEGLARRNGVWADLKIGDDTVRVVSLHLQSTSIRPEDTQFLEEHEYIHDKERDTKMRSIVGRLIDNNRSRAKQAESVAAFLGVCPYKIIVCGDFNDVPLSYTYRTIAKDLDDAFSMMASGFAYTYNTKYRLLRIDHILVSPSIEVCSYEVDNNIEISDHYPVVSRVKVSET